MPTAAYHYSRGVLNEIANAHREAVDHTRLIVVVARYA